MALLLHFTMILKLHKHVKLIQLSRQLFYIVAIIQLMTWLLKCIFVHRVRSVWHFNNRTKLIVGEMDKLLVLEQIQVVAFTALNIAVNMVFKEIKEVKIKLFLLHFTYWNIYLLCLFHSLPLLLLFDIYLLKIVKF